MIELLFVACLTGTPTTCETRAMQFVDLSLMTCMMGAQPQLAAWTNLHPDWSVQHWNCRPLRTDRSL